MNEINIANILIAKRKEKGITQNDLAEYIGVSKASVSKWETGQSYPDITFLPQLAAYFNISLDELMGYSPQMTKEDIQHLYIRFCSDFASKPFDEVQNECQNVIKKYFSCFPLLFQMAVLFANHFMLAKEPEQQQKMLKEATDLCIRVKTESNDVWLSKDAASMEATCFLMMNKPIDALNLLGEDVRPIPNDTEMIAQAYQMMGKAEQAIKVSQISIYQHLLFLAGTSTNYLLMNADHIEKVEETLKRLFGIAKLYDLEKLHPNTMVQIYYTATQIYCTNGKKEEALTMLQGYTDVCLHFFPITLHGDPYFDKIEEWFKDFALNTNPPRNEKVIRESMLQGVLANPAFSILIDSPKYKSIVEKLKHNADK